jgi:hypothetical protein
MSSSSLVWLLSPLCRISAVLFLTTCLPIARKAFNTTSKARHHFCVYKFIIPSWDIFFSSLPDSWWAYIVQFIETYVVNLFPYLHYYLMWNIILNISAQFSSHLLDLILHNCRRLEFEVEFQEERSNKIKFVISNNYFSIVEFNKAGRNGKEKKIILPEKY